MTCFSGTVHIYPYLLLGSYIIKTERNVEVDLFFWHLYWCENIQFQTKTVLIESSYSSYFA